MTKKAFFLQSRGGKSSLPPRGKRACQKESGALRSGGGGCLDEKLGVKGSGSVCRHCCWGAGKSIEHRSNSTAEEGVVRKKALSGKKWTTDHRGWGD